MYSDILGIDMTNLLKRSETAVLGRVAKIP